MQEKQLKNNKFTVMEYSLNNQVDKENPAEEDVSTLPVLFCIRITWVKFYNSNFKTIFLHSVCFIRELHKNACLLLSY